MPKEHPKTQDFHSFPLTQSLLTTPQTGFTDRTSYQWHTRGAVCSVPGMPSRDADPAERRQIEGEPELALAGREVIWAEQDGRIGAEPPF